MAKTSKGKTKDSKIDESVVDAVEVSDDESQEATSTDPVEAGDVAGAPDLTDDAKSDAIEDDAVEDSSDNHDDLDMEIVEDEVEVDGEVEEPAAATFPEPVAPIAPAPEPAKSGGFLPTVFGGLIAGAIGYGAATFFPLGVGSSEVDAQLKAQADQIAALEAQVSEIPTTDLSPLETQISETSARSAEQVDALGSTIGEQIGTLEARIAELEKTPNSDGTLSETAMAAYQAELDQLRAEMETQQQNVMNSAAQAEADLAAAREESARLEQEAIATAEAASNRAALNRIATAVETGAPFSDALAGLESGDIPVALADAADTGVATTAQLVEGFSTAARAALATARTEGVSDDASGIGGFFRSQFDVRSTAPKEGAGPDAVLSRAEAAIKEGRVSDALAEIEALPEVARAEMTDWTARATQRADVLNAIATLSETYN